MKKIRTIILNFLIIIFLLAGTETFFYNKYFQLIKFNKIPYSIKKQDFTLESIKQYVRKPCGIDKNYKKKPILIYGCSYAYGENLPQEETLSYFLSQKAKRPVYNFAMPARGLQHTLYLLENDEKVTPAPEYIFYVFIYDHARRMYMNCSKTDDCKYIYYHLKNGKMVLQKNKYDLSERFYTSKYLKETLYFYLKNLFEEKIYNDLKSYFIAIQDAAKEKYPNTKLVIINYGIANKKILNSQRENELKKDGIEIINLRKEIKRKFNKDIKDDEYRLSPEEDEYKHPNGKAWDIISDYLCEKYKL